jgi:long-chain acyl-CoA synthetase
MLLPELLQRSARRFPNKPAIRFPEGQLTFRELDEQSNRVGCHLRSLGINRGDRVGILYGNTLPAIVFFWGVLKAGATTVDIPFAAAPSVISDVLREVEPKALAAQPQKLEQLMDAQVESLPAHLLSDDTLEEVLADDGDEVAIALDGDPHDVATIVYTSGTTGRPKGVMLSHDNWISNLSASNELMGLTHADSILVVVPFHYVHGRMQLILHMLLSGSVVVSAGFQFPETVVRELAASEVTGMSGVPYHFKQLVKRTSLGKTRIPTLEYVLITGGAMSTSDLSELSQALPEVAIHLAYGQTEASPRITYLGPDDVFGEKRASAGIPIPGVTVQIVNADGASLSTGATGEVVAGGPGIMKGYVTGDERSSGKIDSSGRLRTGDLGYLDESGYLFLAGRSSDMIKTAGERIFPGEIEHVLNRYPGIIESAVVGVPDDTLGERLVAYVVLERDMNLSMGALRRHCLQFMPFVRVPREVRPVDELPKTPSGKLDRGKLDRLPGAQL